MAAARGQAEFVDRQLCLGQAGARRQTKLGEDLLAGDASVVVSEAVYQDGYAKALHEQRQQRRQVGAAAGAVVGRDDDRAQLAGWAAKAWQARVGRGKKAGHLVDCFGLHAQGDGDGAQFEVRYLPIENGAVELFCCAAGHVARTGCAASDLPDDRCQVDSFHFLALRHSLSVVRLQATASVALRCA